MPASQLPNAPLLVIFGINGHQGASVAHKFINDGGWRIRGLTSSGPNTASNQRWAAEGIQIRQVDYADEGEITEAFRGATAIFLVTDFYKMVRDPRNALLVTRERPTPLAVAENREIEMLERIVEAASGEADEGYGLLNSLVVSTLRHAPNQQIPTARGEAMIRTREAIKLDIDRFPSLRPKASYIIPALRMENWADLMRKFGTTWLAHAPMPWLCVAQDFGSYVYALIKIAERARAAETWLSEEQQPSPHLHRFHGHLIGFSDLKTGYQFCQFFSTISGFHCTYRQKTPAELHAQWPAGHIFADLMSVSQAPLYYAPNCVRPQVMEFNFRDQTGDFPWRTHPTSLENFLREDIPRKINFIN